MNQSERNMIREAVAAAREAVARDRANLKPLPRDQQLGRYTGPLGGCRPYKGSHTRKRV